MEKIKELNERAVLPATMSWQRRITDMGNRQAKVLIIEANWDDYWIVKNLFEKDVPNKYNLAWVYNYESALEETPHAEYDMYLLDYDLGHHTGLELLKRSESRAAESLSFF